MAERTEREADAWRRATRILSHRDHSEEELRRKLGVRGFAPDEISGVIGRLRTAGLLDDRRFAEAYVRERVLRRPMGPRGLLRELARRGVEEDTAREAIRAIMDEEGVDEAELVRRLLERRSGGGVRDVHGLFRRRGFDPQIVRMVLEEENG